LPNQNIDEINDSLTELEALCNSAGGEVVGKMTQAMDKMHPGHLFGKGKLIELKQLCAETKATLVIHDGELAPSQQEKLENAIDVAVVDRPALILDIFARHARSREAITQVQLAQLEYLLPRLAGHWTHLERQEAAIGTRGPGETQLETDRRFVKKKITDLKKALARIDQEREVQRKRRSSKINFCLVGYTNAGKSCLFNKLTGDNTYVANKLFATLDSTTRRMPIGGKAEILLTDTVGFIRKLPVDLVASFRSTLKEANSADILIHVVDFAASDIDQKIVTVNEVLSDIGAGNIDRILVFNKLDIAENQELRRNMLSKYTNCFFVSAKTGLGIEELLEYLTRMASELYTMLSIKVPQNDEKAIALITKSLQISNSYIEDSLLVFEGKIMKYDIPKLEKAGLSIEILNRTP
jgi:GTP-binding protein HflX